jgi:hypothetical protein
MTEHEAKSPIGGLLESDTHDRIGVFLLRSRTRNELASIEREEEDSVVVGGYCGKSYFSRGVDRGGGDKWVPVATIPSSTSTSSPRFLVKRFWYAGNVR